MKRIYVAALLMCTVSAFASEITGPSSSSSPYLVRVMEGVVTKSILTVGDSVNNKPDGTPYRMVGIPDGLGAFDNGDGTFTLLMNHELRNPNGVTRAHGSNGAFVSKWIIQKDDLRVLKGEDLIQQVVTWDPVQKKYNAPAKGANFGRYCSADLPAFTAFYDAASGLGFYGRLFMNGEENGNEGRGFAHGLDGTSYEVPRLGKFNWENSVANPKAAVRTLVMGTDDSTPGQVYAYLGQKTATGSPVDRAGLTNGTLYGIKVTGFSTEPAAGIPSGTPFTLASLGNVENTTGAALETASNAAGVTTFNRPEDGSWDPSNPNDFYFVTTASFTGKSRLWRVRFADSLNPTSGGTIDMLLDGTEGQHMFDNITVNDRGQIVLCEDPGDQPHVAKVWRYDIAADRLTMVAQHDPDRFAPGAANFLTQDEESSGVIDVSNILGEGWYLIDTQAHYATDTELVEGGQIMAMHIPPGKKK